jgi:hypothetical protein
MPTEKSILQANSRKSCAAVIRNCAFGASNCSNPSADCPQAKSVVSAYSFEEYLLFRYHIYSSLRTGRSWNETRCCVSEINAKNIRSLSAIKTLKKAVKTAYYRANRLRKQKQHLHQLLTQQIEEISFLRSIVNMQIYDAIRRSTNQWF